MTSTPVTRVRPFPHPVQLRRRIWYLDAAGTRRFASRHALLVSAVLLWLVTLPRIDLDDMSGLGLLSVMPWTGYASLIVLTVSFFIGVHQGRAVFEMAVHLAILILILHATPALLSGTVRYSWAWKHVGIVDFIQRNGMVDPDIGVLDVYHNWPSAFGMAAFFTELAGFGSAASFAAWAPAVFNGLFVAALVSIFWSLTSNRRIVWTATWFFLITNWVGQDYFSPQAFTFFLYLVTIGILLRWFSKRPPVVVLSWAERFRLRVLRGTQVLRLILREGRVAGTETAIISHSDQEASTSLEDAAKSDDARGRLLATTLRGQRQTRLMFGIILVILAAIITSHPLTPMMMIVGLSGLVVVGVGAARMLPIVVAALTAVWMLTGAGSYVTRQFESTVEVTGSVTSNISATFVDLSNAAVSQIVIAWMGRGLVAAVVLLAAFGVVRWIRGGVFDLRPLVLLIAPVFMVVGGSYEGEAVFRVYLFALPFAVFLGAHTFYPERTGEASPGAAAAVIGVGLVLMTAFLFAYFGKEDQYTFSLDEVRAAELVFGDVPDGTLLIEGSANYPSKFLFYERFVYVPISLEPQATHARILADPVGVMEEWMGNLDYPESYLIITASQKAEIEALGIMPPGTLDAIEAALLASPRFEALFYTENASVFTLADAEEGS
ncbi:MAG: hypothetical protein IH941_07275 [Acidobacteria bacterium]|nr:hypothetical protein [Acidobacteriota bacterium]